MIGMLEVITFMSVLLGLLLSGNLFFIRKLVEKIDKTSEAQEKQASSFASLTEQIKDIKCDVKELRRMEIEIAVLRTQLKNAESMGEA